MERSRTTMIRPVVGAQMMNTSVAALKPVDVILLIATVSIGYRPQPQSRIVASHCQRFGATRPTPTRSTPT